MPYAAPKASKVTSSIVLLVRIPGSLEKVGVMFETGAKASEKWQQDFEGNEYHVPSN